MYGIYQIHNKVNNKVYIGSSQEINKRFRAHRNMLLKNNHDNIYLQRAWNKYGEDSFSFEIILLCEEFELLRYEQWFLDNWKPKYNIAKFADAPNRGKSFSKEHIENLSKSHKGQLFSEETRNKLSIARRNRKDIPASKLSKEQVLQIRKMYATKNYTYRKLGKLFNISYQHIGRIIRYERWGGNCADNRHSG